MKWLDIPELEGKFQVSDCGKIRNSKTGRILKLHKTKLGRITVNVKPNGRYAKSKTLNVHRCVALAFLHRDDESLEVNHIDGDPTNNHISNLEWVTHSENMMHAYKNNLIKIRIGENANPSKLTMEQIIEIRKIGKSKTLREIANLYGVSHPVIYDILIGKSYKEFP